MIYQVHQCGNCIQQRSLAYTDICRTFRKNYLLVNNLTSYPTSVFVVWLCKHHMHTTVNLVTSWALLQVTLWLVYCLELSTTWVVVILIIYNPSLNYALSSFELLLWQLLVSLMHTNSYNKLANAMLGCVTSLIRYNSQHSVYKPHNSPNTLCGDVFMNVSVYNYLLLNQLHTRLEYIIPLDLPIIPIFINFLFSFILSRSTIKLIYNCKLHNTHSITSSSLTSHVVLKSENCSFINCQL